MKEFLGIRVTILVDGYKVVGTVLDDKADRVIIKDDDGKLIRVIKNKVIMFTPEREPEKHIPLQLLCCHNTEMKCPGVQYVAEGDTLSRESFSVFMSPCPSKCQSCQCGTKGDLRTVSSITLKNVMCGVLFGDYPEEKKK